MGTGNPKNGHRVYECSLVRTISLLWKGFMKQVSFKPAVQEIYLSE